MKIVTKKKATKYNKLEIDRLDQFDDKSLHESLRIYHQEKGITCIKKKTRKTDVYTKNTTYIDGLPIKRLHKEPSKISGSNEQLSIIIRLVKAQK